MLLNTIKSKEKHLIEGSTAEMIIHLFRIEDVSRDPAKLEKKKLL